MYEDRSKCRPELQRFLEADRHRLWKAGIRKGVYNWQFALAFVAIVIAGTWVSSVLSTGLENRLAKKLVLLGIGGAVYFLCLRPIVERHARRYWSSIDSEEAGPMTRTPSGDPR
jgi:hypothetical protein